MEFRQIQYFVTVAEVLNFGRAAEQLGIGQPGVSQQVARLERELGVQLFDRSARAIRLTEPGQRFLPAARAVLAAVETARAAATGSSRTLRLGTSTGLGERLETVVAELSSQGLYVELVSTSTRARLDRVRSRQLDAAFVRGTTEAAGLEFLPVWEDDLLVALPKATAPDGTVSLKDLRQIPLRITQRRTNPPLVDLVISACAAEGFEPVLGPRSSSLQDTHAAIGAGTPSWTVIYESHARLLREGRVAFRRPRPRLALTTSLAVPAGTTVGGDLAVLLAACRKASDQFE
ncbi:MULTISPECIES: LysR family transcriptional regulator [Kribbella]|uniref:LysR family transcriptional regulator n=1 Tax=Kribbella karoonensis TaxID=324851 RepID=A0ABN2DS69_9ACTN